MFDSSSPVYPAQALREEISWPARQRVAEADVLAENSFGFHNEQPRATVALERPDVSPEGRCDKIEVE
jgi:hypothetical protein